MKSIVFASLTGFVNMHARLGTHVVLIQSKNVQGADYNYFGSTSARGVLTGIAYGYEKPAN